MTFLLFFVLLLVGMVTRVDLPCVTVLLSDRMDNFHTKPTLEARNSLKKKELTEAATHYELEIPENASKAAIKKLALNYLVEEELIAEPVELSSDTMRGQQLLELKRL